MSKLSGKNKKAFADFVKKLKALGADIQQAEVNVVSKTTAAAKEVTLDKTPVKTGTLKGRWTDIPLIVLNGKISKGYANDLYYAGYVNDGHRTVNKAGETVGYVTGFRMLERGITRGRLAMRPLMDEEIRQIKHKTGF